MSNESVAVIVPTCNREAFLPELVAALKAQTLSRFAAVIVDDGSRDDSLAALNVAIDGDERFRVISTPNRGPASARNAGVRDVDAEWVAFTDDDCLPQPRWLEALLQTARDAGAEVVQGRTVSDPTVRRRDLPWFVRGKTVSAWSGHFETCNLLVKTERLHQVGGFDESFPPRGFGEDTDLGFRLLGAGATTAFATDAAVHHRVLVMTYREYLRRRYRWAQVVHMVSVNPETRARFLFGHIAQRAHVAFWVSLPVAVWAFLTGRWWVPGLLVTAFVVFRVAVTRQEDRPLPVRAARGVLELVGVAVGAVGFLVESVRHRTLLV